MSSADKPTVLVLGGGISGLSTAMELASDFEVTVVEKRPIVGGKSRTWTDERFNVFREHSFRVFHQTYDNLFDTMRRIPAGYGARSVKDNLEEYTSTEKLKETYPQTWEEYRRRGGEISWLERFLIARDIGALLRLLCASDSRLEAEYATRDFEQVFAERGDGTRGIVFDVLRGMSQVEYSANRVNPDAKIMVTFIEKHFLHGAPGTGWFALKGPTSDAFIEPWRQHLERRGVRFETDIAVTKIAYDEARRKVEGVLATRQESDQRVELQADYYVSALTSDVLLDVVDPGLRRAVPTLEVLTKLHRVGNNGLQIFTSREQEVLGGYHLWHPWRPAVTAYAGRWAPRFNQLADMGVGSVKGKIRDVLSYCLTDWEEPGGFIEKPARDCTPEEIYEEVCWFAAQDKTVVRNFDRADHVELTDASGKRTHCLVDDALIYDETGTRIVANEDSLVHLPPGAYFKLPRAETPVGNFILAGTHCHNEFACGDSQEGAAETGRHAANAVLQRAGATRRVPILNGRLDSPVVQGLELARGVDRALLRLGF